MYGDRIWREWKIWFVTWAIITTIGIFTFLTHTQYEYFIERKFPRLGQTKYRVLYKLLQTLFILTPGALLVFFVFHQFNILGYRFQGEELKYGFLVGLWVNLTFGTLFEVEYILNKYKETAAEKELLEKLQLDQEFEQLKQKVNPHFLFNCFNALSSLITEDKNKAEKFLDELSKVYRYLLRNNEDGMSTLESEMKFIESYFQLLKTRHGDAVHLHVNIDEQYNYWLLPSLSLQLLLENAVKHNNVLKTSPLVIEITTTGNGWLSLKNNLQKKTSNADSSKLGLKNIREKYHLLNKPDIIIKETVAQFEVMLPLIENLEKLIPAGKTKQQQ
jgi:sensor histidine kinase YesM